MQLESSLEVERLDVLLRGVHVGTLAQTSDGLAAFQYSPEWLHSGFSISPFSLPLEGRVFVAQRHPLDGLFGVFSDSLPDGWGRLLIDRKLREQGIDPVRLSFLSRLAIVGTSGAGALEYRPSITLPNCDMARLDLDAVAQDCADVLAARDVQDLDALFAMGGSSGGARPKVFYMIDGEEWIVKFPSSFDSANIGESEYALALAAKKCGIAMPEVLLLPSRNCSGYFATKRFDRIGAKEGAVQKVHMVSVGALLETSHRIPNLDYDLLMRLVLRLTGDMGEVEQMFLRMVFNVLCGNRDDHSKNTSFVYGGQGEGYAASETQDGELCLGCSWHLSPAYDITQNGGMNGEHATTVNGKGKDITENDMLSVAQRAGIPKSHAKEMISMVKEELSV